MKKTLMALLLILTLAGCGGDSEAEKEAEAGRGTITCEGEALSGATGLPANFAKLEETT